MRYHNITTDDMLNGEGLRTVLWLSGCNHHCKNCQNPLTWDPIGGLEFDSDAEVELFEKLGKDYISGITFSGGDPLHENNIKDVLGLINTIREVFPEKTIWLYSGYTVEEIFYNDDVDMKIRQEILKKVDVFVDGRYEEDKKDAQYHWAGSRNQKVIRMKEFLHENVIL